MKQMQFSSSEQLLIFEQPFLSNIVKRFGMNIFWLLALRSKAVFRTVSSAGWFTD